MPIRPEQMDTNVTQVELSNLDRLSTLPDEVLHCIMGFLSARKAVQTCILSKTWKNLWRNLSSLNFYCRGFHSDDRFINFVNTFLNHWENTKIDSFELDWYPSFAQSEPTKTWILYALNFQPQSIYINIEVAHSFRTLPDSLFGCNSLEVIYLQMGNLFFREKFSAKSINLPNLKRLCVNHATLNGEFMTKLISGSPKLEELIMENCFLCTSGITINSYSLKNLIIGSCVYYDGSAFHLSIPSLLSLHVVGADLGDIRVDGMPSLIKACIHFNQIFKRPQKSGYELLRALSNVTHLELIGRPYLKTTKSMTLRVPILKNLLEKELPACGAFVKLKNLHLSDWCMNDDFDIIARFIQLSPNLETLTLSHEKEILREFPKKFQLQIQFKRPEIIVIKCSLEHERVNELVNTLKAYLGTYNKFNVDFTGNFSSAFCKAGMSCTSFNCTTHEYGYPFPKLKY